MEKINNINRPPLPFTDPKYRWKIFFENFAKKLNPGDVIIDIFGGSGYISHIVKATAPDGVRVIWNDADNYSDRLNMIPQTCELLDRLAWVRGKYGISTSTKLTDEDADKVRALLYPFIESDALDQKSFKTWTTFFSKFEKNVWIKKTIYNLIPSSDGIKSIARGYLDGVEVLHSDFRDVLNYAETIQTSGRIIYIADPPYPTTMANGYLLNYSVIDDIYLIEYISARPHIYFSSNRNPNIFFFKKYSKIKNIANPLDAGNIVGLMSSAYCREELCFSNLDFKKKMKEKEIEKKCVTYARRLGWDAWKNENNNNTGIPDFSFLKNGVFFLVEFKKDARAHIRPEQLRWYQKHADTVFFIFDFEDFKKLIDVKNLQCGC